MAGLRVLVVNAGSTSLKLRVVETDGSASDVASLDDVPAVDAVGHRVVHGGERFVEPTLIDAAVEEGLRELVDLAPLHNAPALEGIDCARAALPGVPHVAVFDTAFHRTLPEVARTLPLPERFRARGVRRFGFHGISVQWAAEQVPVARLVVCHLGGGSSVTAVRDGESIDTSMGFTPLDGVPMATRSGAVDPGALVYLLRHGLSADELDDALEHESGMTSLAGTGDMRQIAQRQTPSATLAFDLYCRRVAQTVAAMAVSLGGLDTLVFTGGIGEHSAPVRERVSAEIEAAGLRPSVEVVEAREDLVIARAVRDVVDI